MKVTSLISEKGRLTPVEVELTLWPGLPGIQFLGLPDQHLKESALRIKSAIKNQGFEFPKARQILVNLRPSHLKKNSRGLELAVAAAYLWETQQVPRPLLGKNFYVYGELNLSGEVFEPEDLEHQAALQGAVVLTGADGRGCKEFRRLVIPHLQRLSAPSEIAPEDVCYPLQRPELASDFRLSAEQAEVLEVAALGGHSLLLAGPAGSGKSTMARALHALLPLPEPNEWKSIVEIQRRWGVEPRWRPLVKPHSSTPKISMIGGGAVPLAGEISRAHGGILLMDEFLEFSRSVQEALREPFEERLIRVARGGQVQEFPAGGLIIGTTNLCPCGEKIPGEPEGRACRFSRLRCNSYSQRLSGPILDRFQMLIFLKKLARPTVPWQKVRDRIDLAVQFRRQRQSLSSNGGLEGSLAAQAEEVESSLGPAIRQDFFQDEGSERRRIATLCVARSFADLEGRAEVSLGDLDRAMNWTTRTFDKMRRWDLELGPTL